MDRRHSIVATVLAVALLVLFTACERPTPTPTPPPPSPTPTPEPTPEPTAVERLAWFDTRPDTAHWIAWNALRRMAIDDEPLTQQIASLDWVADGITVEEAGVLDDVSWLLRENPAVADTALGLPWMATDGVISADDRRALRAIRATASTNENLGATFADYEWLADGLTQDEAEALETIGEIVAPDFTAHTATGIGAIRLDRSGIGTPPSVSPRQLEFATSVSQFPWMQDNVTSPETVFIANLNGLVETAGSIHASAADTIVSYGWVQDGIELNEPRSLLLYEPLFQAAGAEDADILPIMLEYEWIADGLGTNEARSAGVLTSLLNASSSDDADVLTTMVNYPWLTDSIDGYEYELLSELPDFLRFEEAEGATYRQTVLGYNWLLEDITPSEVAGFRFMSNSVASLSPEGSDALDSLLAYEWLRDDVREEEVLSIRALENIIRQYGPDTDEFITALITRPWLRDEVQERENWLLEIYGSHLAGDHYPDPTVKEGPVIPSSPDGNGVRLEAWDVGPVWSLLHQLPPNSLETTTAIIEASVFQPKSMIEIAGSLSQFSAVVSVSESAYGSDLTPDIIGMPWLFDGIEGLERWWLYEYTWLLRELDGESEELARSLLTRPWARDGISADEREWTHQYRRLLEDTTGKTREDALEFANLSWFQDRIDIFAAGAMGRLAAAAFRNESVVIEHDWPDDGISEADLVLRIALIDAQARSEHQYRDLLEQSNIAQRTLNLPLAGDVELYVVRHTEFPGDDPTLDLMEQIIVQLEEFMGVPFPRTPAIILITEPSTQAGEKPQFGLGLAFLSHILISAPRHNPGFHLAVFHEISHMYWGGYVGAPVWWNEGAAGFLPDIARDALGHESLEERHHELLQGTRDECWHRGVADISTYYHLQKTQPQIARDRGICVYALGEIFLMEMYLLLGYDTTSAAMRQLYVDARDSQWFDPITDQKIYDAFRANTPDDKVEEFRKLFLRLHGGARVDLSESST